MKNLNQFEITGRLTEMKMNYPTDIYFKLKIVNVGTKEDETDDGQMYEDSIHMNIDESNLKAEKDNLKIKINDLVGKRVQLKGYLDIKKDAPNSVKLEATSISEI